MQKITLGDSRRKNKTIKSKIIAGILLILLVFLSVFKPKIKQSNISEKIEFPTPKEIQ